MLLESGILVLMNKTISKTVLYRRFKDVTDDVTKNGTLYLVTHNSKPVFYIKPNEAIELNEK